MESEPIIPIFAINFFTMQIGFDAKRAFWNNTGLGNYSRFLINGLAEFVNDNTYFLYSPGLKAHSEMKDALGRPNVHQVDLGSGLIGKAKRAIGFKYNKLNIFHGLSNELPFFAKNGKTKLIVSIHDLLFLRYPDFYPFLDRQIYLAKTKRACSQADLIIAISKQTKQDLIDFLNVPASKIKVHYQSCHPQFLNSYSESQLAFVREKYGILKPYILQVGTLENRKNALLTIQAFAQSEAQKTHQLVLVGKQTAYCDELYEFAKKNTVSGRVKFIHQADFQDFPALYQSASLSVYPSLFEGFGIPILEAMCSGVPVITSQDGCFSEVGGDAVLYIDPKDALDFQLKIDHVLSDENFRQQLIAKGKTQAEKFSLKSLILELEEIYHQLLNT